MRSKIMKAFSAFVLFSTSMAYVGQDVISRAVLNAMWGEHRRDMGFHLTCVASDSLDLNEKEKHALQAENILYKFILDESGDSHQAIMNAYTVSDIKVIIDIFEPSRDVLGEQLFGDLQTYRMTGGELFPNICPLVWETSIEEYGELDFLSPSTSKLLQSDIFLAQSPSENRANANSGDQRVDSSTVDEEIVEAAFGFMIFGDQGWNANTVEVYSSDPFGNCKIDFKSLRGAQSVVWTIHHASRIALDLNRAYWNSAVTQNVSGKLMFSVSGATGFARINPYTNPYDFSEIEFEIPVTLERFRNAFSDLVEQCPGVTTRY